MMLRQIRHFQTIIQENSFTEAAELCHISQSGISQSIKALEDEIGVKLITRKNRNFELTEAGKHFYKKSLVITADLEQLCRETVRIDRKDAAELSLGVLSTYSGDEFNRAIAAFSEKYPEVELSVATGNHEDLYDGLRFGKIDIALNDQRRAFSDEYENLILMETACYVELASHNPLTKLMARQELKALVDNYATESDRNNQDYYVNVFTEDCHVRVYFNNELGMDLKNVKDLIEAYKGFGAAKESFHMNGQQVVNFQDDEHATGTCYALAHLVNEKDSITGTQGITITILLLVEVMERHLNVLNAENARRSVRSIFLSEIF